MAYLLYKQESYKQPTEVTNVSTITLAVIESQIETLNRMTERTTQLNDTIPGNSIYQLDRSNGGNQLVLKHADTSESNITTRLSKRELSNQLSAIINVLSREA